MTGLGVLDASLLLSLGGVDALDLLWSVGTEWHVPPIARSEVRSDPTRWTLDRAILEARLHTTEIDTSAPELTAFADWTRRVDVGEAEAIAIGVARGWTIGIEDRHAQRQITRHAPHARWVNAAGILVMAIRSGAMTVGDADALFRRLDAYTGYVKRGVTGIADLLPP